ncbi:unnamed protein product, partial [Rotaria sp. Silwood2]
LLLIRDYDHISVYDAQRKRSLNGDHEIIRTLERLLNIGPTKYKFRSA